MRELKADEKAAVLEGLQVLKSQKLRRINAEKNDAIKALLVDEAAKIDNLAVVFR